MGGIVSKDAGENASRLLAEGLGNAARHLAEGLGNAARHLAEGLGNAARHLAEAAWYLSIAIVLVALIIASQNIIGIYLNK